jgi:hypothetical protein
MLNSFFENLAVYEIMCKKHDTVGQVTDDNTAHAYFKLYTSGYGHTLMLIAFPLQQ